MTRHIHQTTTHNGRSGSTVGQLRREMVHLRRDMDLYERLYSTWQNSRRLRDKQAEVRFHVIEAQLARLSAVGTMDFVKPRPLSPCVSPQPVAIPIGSHCL